LHSFETQPDPGPGRVEEKIEEGKIRCDSVDPVTRQDLIKNPVATRWLLFFLLKRHHFDLKKKNIDLSDPVKTRDLEPETRALDRVWKLWIFVQISKIPFNCISDFNFISILPLKFKKFSLKSLPSIFNTFHLYLHPNYAFFYIYKEKTILFCKKLNVGYILSDSNINVYWKIKII